MSEKDTGGPAFPNPGHDNGPGNFRSRPSEGMTLRDYFAAKAMQGELSSSTLIWDKNVVEAVAENAYAFADAMLIAREA